MSKAFEVRLHEIYLKRPALIRYSHALLSTVAVLFRSRPRVVLIQVPSLVLALSAILLATVFRFRLVCDQHNETIEPFIHTASWYRRLCAFVMRHAALNIVTNNALAAVVQSHGGRAAVLPDKIPHLPVCERLPAGSARHVVFICSFAPDEPYVEVIEAARTLGPDVTVHVTGNASNRSLPELPGNVRLTGYVPDAQYLRLLCAADAIVDLTMMDNCLVCGAYEAVSLHKPLVTSATAALEEYFGRAAVYCGNEREGIAAAIRSALDNGPALALASAVREGELRASWEKQRADVIAVIERLRERR